MSRRPYKRPMPRNWYMNLGFYKAYMIRETGVILLALYAINMLVGLGALIRGAEAWSSWVALQANPGMILLSVVTLGVSLYNTMTWFEMAPRAMPPLFIGQKKVDTGLIKKGHWGGFVVVTIVVLIAALWGV